MACRQGEGWTVVLIKAALTIDTVEGTNLAISRQKVNA